MLVLTRKTGESIVIDGAIYVTILEICGKKVRLGVEAPPEVRVDRSEVHVRRAGFEPTAYEYETAAERLHD